MPDKTPTQETINETILRIIGLESLDGVSYDDYYRLLLEQIISIESGESELSSREVKIIQEEAKKIKPFAKKNPDEMVNEKLNIRRRTVNRDKLFKNKEKPKVTTKPKKSLVPKRIIRKPSGTENNEEALNSILGSVNSILQILQNQSSFEKKVYNKERREKEQEQRTDKENKLESAFSKGISALKSISSKVFSPFQDIIGKLINFFTWVFLGKAFQSFMKWVNDPKNAKKVEFLSNFLKTFWPAILAAVVLFLTPIGGLIRAVTATVIKWTVKLAKVAIPRLLKFIAKHPLAAGAIAVGATIAGATVLGKNKEDENINRILQKEAEAEGKTLPEKQKENEQNKSWVDRFGDAFNFGNLGMGGVSPLGFSQGGTIPNIEHGYNGIDGNTGEDISGAGRDTQLIAARPGEVVLTPEDQSYIYQNTGFDIPGFVGNRKPKFISGSNLRFTNPSLFGKDNTRIPKFEAGGVVGGYKPSSGTKDFGEEPLVRVAMQNGIRGDELAAFLAQTSHETGEFKWKRELGGGKDSYSGGKKYHGRGYIQITHDYNYKHYGDKIGVDLVNNPDLALKPDIAARIAVEYWKENVRPTVKGNWKDPFLHSKAVNYPAASSPSQINGYEDRVKKFNYYRNNIQKITQKSAPKPEIKISGKVLNSQKIGGSVYTERAGGVYTRNGVPISKDSYSKSVGSKQRFNPMQTIKNVASTVTGAGRRPAQAKPKSKKSNHQKLVEKRPWFDKFGWFGGPSRWNKKQGGGYIGESSGINLPGMTADRQLLFSQFGPIATQPGEYILPVDTVMKLGGKRGVDRLVERTDSNSKAALDGKILNPISKDFGITPYKTNVEIASLPGMNMAGQGGSPTMSGEPGGSSEDFHSPISPVAGSTRATIFQILGIIA